MNIIFTNLIVILLLILIKQAIIKRSKKTVKDERTELVGLKASRTTFVIFTTTIGLSSFVLIFFGEHGMTPSFYLYSLGVIMSYLTCLILILFIILYIYFNKEI